MTNDNKKLYRVDWKHTSDLAPGQVFDEYLFVPAASELEATADLHGTDFRIREASIEEIEAYVRGYEDGYDIGIVTERLKDLNETKSASLEDFEGI
jgi:hypothetical protein